MDLQVTAAGRDEQKRLAGLFELYIYDFSELLGLDVGEDGRFQLPALEPYWTDPGHHPFLIRVDATLAGFALVQERSRLTDQEGVRDMAEFFVMRRYRRRGVGVRAASLLFDRFQGPWEVRQRPENRDATAFWRRAIAHYTGGRFDDAMWNDERWRGPVQRFESAR
ncbi:MAG TPA: GNAT family N-acetyltransferase [Polyangiaceae bacterium]|nr:GNAT family N-acetyltransferase [Polyangiaceae bacterium]